MSSEQPKILLLIDDDPLNTDFLELLFGRLYGKGNYSLLIAHNAPEASELIQTQEPDAMAIDWLIGDTTGPQFYAELVGLGITIPAVFMSADLTGLTLEVERLGFDAECFRKRLWKEIIHAVVRLVSTP